MMEQKQILVQTPQSFCEVLQIQKLSILLSAEQLPPPQIPGFLFRLSFVSFPSPEHNPPAPPSEQQVWLLLNYIKTRSFYFFHIF